VVGGLGGGEEGYHLLLVYIRVVQLSMEFLVELGAEVQVQVWEWTYGTIFGPASSEC